MSCIIPVYNGEHVIKKCLDSIVTQVYFEHIEVIVINDGSKDKTRDLLKQYESFKNIKIIDTKNGGVARARNVGLEEAEGELITFVDSDDYLEPGYFKYFFENYNGEDLYVFSFKSNIPNMTEDIKKSESVDGEQFIRRLVSISYDSIYGYLWRCFFTREILKDNKIRFEDGIKMSEDFLFIFSYALHCKQIKLDSNAFYNYYVNQSSTTARYIDKLQHDMEYVNQKITVLLNSNEIDLIDEVDCCKANTCLMILQNVMKFGNNQSFFDKFSLIKSVLDKYDYSLKRAYKIRDNLRKNLVVFLVFFRCRLVFLYLFLYKIRLIFTRLR